MYGYVDQNAGPGHNEPDIDHRRQFEVDWRIRRNCWDMLDLFRDRTVLIANNVSLLTKEANVPIYASEDIRNIKKIAEREDAFELLANSLTPSFYGHAWIKKAIVLLMLGGIEKNLKNRTHFRGELYNNKISGKIPPVLGNLKSLVNLELYLNKLNGPIPNELGNLLKMCYVEIMHAMWMPQKFKYIHLLATLYVFTLTIPSATAVYWAFRIQRQS